MSYNKITYVLKKRISSYESLSFYENWTNKVELEINKKDFSLALSTLQEITVSILSAGHFEEYFRISILLFKQIDFSKHYNNETPYLLSQIRYFVILASEISEFEEAKNVLNKFKNVLKNKGKDYILYCYLECSYHWNNLDYLKAVEWGNKAVNLVRDSKIEIDFDLEHTQNLAKRDSREKKYLEEALVFFLKGKDIHNLISSQIDDNLSAPYYGNLGRCYFFLNEYSIAKALYFRSFYLCYQEDNEDKFINRGYASYWLAQVLQKEGNNKTAFFFYSNCILYWKKHSPHRAERVEEERKILLREIPDSEDILRIDSDTIEIQCKTFNEKQLRLTRAIPKKGFREKK